MIRLAVMFLILLATACAPTTPADNTSSIIVIQPPTPNTIAPPSAEERTQLDRLTEAKGLGIFNFSELTRDNCDATTQRFHDLLFIAREDVERLEDTLEDELDDLRDAQQELQDAQQLGDQNLVDKRNDDLSDQEADVENIEDDLRDAQKREGKHRIVLAEIEKACLRLHAGSGNPP